VGKLLFFYTSPFEIIKLSPNVLKLHCTFTANFTADFYDRQKKTPVKTGVFEFCFE